MHHLQRHLVSVEYKIQTRKDVVSTAAELKPVGWENLSTRAHILGPDRVKGLPALTDRR